MPKVRMHQNVYYWPTYTEARTFARDNEFPTDRIIYYELGWAVQIGISGDYVGPHLVALWPLQAKE